MRRLLHFVFLLSIILLILRPQEFIPALQESSIVQIVMILALAIWAGVRETHAGLGPVKWVVGMVFCASISSGLNGWWGGAAAVFVKLLPAIAFFLLASSSTQLEDEFKRFSWVIVLCCLVLVFHGWQQVTYGVGFTGMAPVEENRIRYIGVLNDPNDLGVLFCIGFVLTGYLYWIGEKRLVRMFSALAGAYILYGVYLTQSRGTMLACLAAIACVGVRKYGIGRCMLVASILLPILWGATRLSTISSDDESAEGRIDAWYEGFQMLRENPLFGVSMGGFVDHNDLTAHNSIVLAMAELGVIGYTFWFLFFVHSASLGARAAHLDALDIRSDKRDAARAVVVAGISVFVAAMFLSRSYNPLLFMVCGLAAGRYAAGLLDPADPVLSSDVPVGKMVMWAWLSIPIMYVVTIILLNA